MILVTDYLDRINDGHVRTSSAILHECVGHGLINVERGSGRIHIYIRCRGQYPHFEYRTKKMERAAAQFWNTAEGVKNYVFFKKINLKIYINLYYSDEYYLKTRNIGVHLIRMCSKIWGRKKLLVR